MFEDQTKVRVRYAETDQMGIVYYGNYAQYFEVGRVEALRTLGFSYRSMEESGYRLPVIDLQVKYKNPARYDDELTIRTYIREVPDVRIRFEYEIKNSQQELICSGETTLVFVDIERGRPCRAPEKIVAALAKHIN